MKLLYCKNCRDVVALIRSKTRKCFCGETSGRYTDNLNAIYSGEHALPFGIDNPSFMKARMMTELMGEGEDFTAFVITEDCKTFNKVETIETP